MTRLKLIRTVALVILVGGSPTLADDPQGDLLDELNAWRDSAHAAHDEFTSHMIDYLHVSRACRLFIGDVHFTIARVIAKSQADDVEVTRMLEQEFDLYSGAQLDHDFCTRTTEAALLDVARSLSTFADIVQRP